MSRRPLIALPSEGSRLILELVAASDCSRWCFLPLQTRAVTLCSRSFLEYWNVQRGLHEVFNEGLPIDATESLPPPGHRAGLIPSLFDVLNQVANGRFFEARQACEPLLDVVLQPVITEDGVPLGRLLLFGNSAHIEVPPETAFDVRIYRKRLRGLSEREREVLDLVIEGCTNRVIATRLAVSPKTIEKHRQRIMDKLQLPSTLELVRLVTLSQFLAQ